MNSQRLRLLLLAVVITGGCLVLFYRLWFLQIEKQDEYIQRQPVTATARQRVPGSRGEILDRNGVEFARNETNIEIALDLAAVEAAWLEREHAKPRKERRKIPKFLYGPHKEETTDIVALLNELVFPELDRLKLYHVPPDAEKKKLEDALILSYVSNKGVIPFPYEKNLNLMDDEDFRRFTAYAENAPNIPGLTITERAKRRYPFQAMAGHLVGFLREERNELPPEEEKREKWDYREADDIGMAGLELSQDEKLRPKPGERIWRVNEHGRLTDEIKEQRREPLPGADVFLTIDARIQYIAEMALRDSKAGRAAAVVLDPNTGAVLGMASLPSYDPSIFLPPKDEAAITRFYEPGPATPSAVLPLALRADRPGSSFKLMIALSAAMSGRTVIHPYTCNGSLPFGNRSVKCMGTHGTLNLSDAIMKSCNCYFMQLALNAKIENIQKVTRLFNFGGQDSEGKSGIEVPELEFNGRIKSDTGTWNQHSTALVGIGQGGASCSPLQLAMLASAIANGGKVYQPTLIHHYEEQQYDRDGRRQRVISEFKPKLLADLATMGASRSDLEAMREGMRKVVNAPGGTASRAKSTLVTISGKTSTAERMEGGKKVNRVWFMAFAPHEKPTIAVAVLVVNGFRGGRVAAPIAKRIVEQTLGVQNGTYHVKPQPLEPAAGSYNYLEEVVFEGDSIPPGEVDAPETPETPDEDPGDIPTPSTSEIVPPRAKVVPEDGVPALARQALEPVKFRLKTDPPNPPRQPLPVAGK